MSELPFEIAWLLNSQGEAEASLFLLSVEPKARADLVLTLEYVALAPPYKANRMAGRWEAMHGEMTGWFEARKQFGNRLYRLYCFLDAELRYLVVATGRKKMSGETLSSRQYEQIRELREHYYSTMPRPIA